MNYHDRVLLSATFAVHIYMYVYMKAVSSTVAPLLYGVPFVPKILSVLFVDVYCKYE